MRGKAAIANAQLAYQRYEQVFASDRWQALAAAGARPQRPLWASTSTKNPDYRDVMYVEELVAPGVVNTMPEATIHAFADHGEVKPGVVRPSYAQAQEVLDDLAGARHRLRRRHRHAGARGRGEVRGQRGTNCSRASRPSWPGQRRSTRVERVEATK